MKIGISAVVAAVAFLAATTQFANAADGKALFEENCASCHMPEADQSHDDLVAPPMFGVMMNYRMAFADRAQAVDAIASWVREPSEEKSVMPAAIQQFELMPPVDISAEDARAIAEYVTTAQFNPPMMGHGMMRGQGNQ